MKKINNLRLKPLLFLQVFLVGFMVSQAAIFAPRAEALDNINLDVINKTELRITSITLSNTDYNNLNSGIKEIGDISTIRTMLNDLYVNKRFIDNDIWDSEDDYRLRVERSGESCEGEIDVAGPTDPNFTIKLRVPLANGDCPTITTDNSDIRVSNPGNLLIAFTWVDETTMRPYQRAGDTFTLSPGQTGIYRRDAEEGDGDCRDYVTTINFTDGDFHYKAPLPSGPQSAPCEELNYWSEVAQRNEPPGPMPIRIANVEARSIPPGQGDPDAPGGGGGAAGDEVERPSCEEANPGISLSWFICSLLNFLDDTVSGLNSAVGELLEINSDYYTDEGLQKSWSYFRNIASFLLIVIGLVMIIGQAISKD